MRPVDQAAVRRWAAAFGWEAKVSANYGIFKRETHYIVVAWQPVPPGGSIAYRTTDPSQSEPDYATNLGTVCEWLTEPRARRANPSLRDPRFDAPAPPAPAPPPPEPTPSEQFNARSVARFKEMEF